MNIEVLNDANSVAQTAAAWIAAEARKAVRERGQFVFAVSGGKTPWLMLSALAGEAVPWDGVHLVQVDERVAPAGHPDRNLTHLQESLLARVSLRPQSDPLNAGGKPRLTGRSSTIFSGTCQTRWRTCDL